MADGFHSNSERCKDSNEFLETTQKRHGIVVVGWRLRRFMMVCDRFGACFLDFVYLHIVNLAKHRRISHRK